MILLQFFSDFFNPFKHNVVKWPNICWILLIAENIASLKELNSIVGKLAAAKVTYKM